MYQVRKFAALHMHVDLRFYTHTYIYNVTFYFHNKREVSLISSIIFIAQAQIAVPTVALYKVHLAVQMVQCFFGKLE